jgi:hypothetical protein
LTAIEIKRNRNRMCRMSVIFTSFDATTDAALQVGRQRNAARSDLVT